MNKIKILYICFIYITLIIFQSCGSFGEGMMAAMMGYAGGGYSGYSSPSSTYTNAYGGSSMDYLLDPNYAIMQTNSQMNQMNRVQENLIRKTIKDVSEQEQAEYHAAKQFRPGLTLEQFRYEKAQAYQYMNETKGESATSSRSITSKSSKTTYDNRHGYKDCHACLGLKKCATCNGKGWIRHTMTNTTGDCPNCTNGVCSTCGGDGKVYGLK